MCAHGPYGAAPTARAARPTGGTMTRRLVALAALVAALAFGVSAYAYQAEAVVDGGTIAGTVRYAGKPPKPERVEITKDIGVCGAEPHYSEALIVGADGGIKYAVVTLKDIEKGEPIKPVEVKFDQKGCEYHPHVIALPAGGTVDIINSDGILHNVHTESKANPPFNLAQPGFKRLIRKKLDKPDLIEVSCDVHNWMRGWWYVAASPYYAVTDAAGHYTISNVPPGTYTLQVWQETLGTRERKVDVKPGKTVTVDFELSAKTNK